MSDAGASEDEIVVQRELWDAVAARRMDAELRLSIGDGETLLTLQVDGEAEHLHRGSDVEDALQALRVDVESSGRLLLINRFRRDAFVSPMSRQQSGGLRCYLVLPRRAVDPSRLVDCLGPAEVPDVVIAAEARDFIARWQARPPLRARLAWAAQLMSRR